MEERIGRLEQEVRDLARTVGQLQSRVAALEQSPVQAMAAEPATEPSAAAEPVATAGRWTDTSGLLPYAGRFFLVMGGAFLLRALTEASLFSAAVGVSVGLAYALFWAVIAGPAAARGKWWSAAMDSLAATAVAYPLLWEAATRFRILRFPFDVALLAGLSAAFLAVSWRYRFQPLAWLSTAGAVVAGTALTMRSPSFLPGTVFLVVLGVTCLWLGYELEWKGLRWFAAIAANVAVLGLTLRAIAAEPRESPGSALTAQLLMLGLYLSSVAVRTLVRARNVIVFEVAQVVAAFLLGFVGAVYTARATGVGVEILGMAGVGLGAACYAVAFAFVDRRVGRGKNFYFYTSLALLFALSGSSFLMQGTALTAAWVLLAVAMAWLGSRYSRLALAIHATVSIVAAAFASGLVRYAWGALAGPAELAGATPLPAHILVILGAGLCLSFPLPSQPEVGAIWFRVHRLAIALVLVGGVGGVIDSLAGRIWAGMPAGGVQPGNLATVRTVVLAAAALVLAWMGRRKQFEEWGWLVYPVLAAAGAKIVFEDLSRSRPATLFIALAAFGCALILSPRLKRAPLVNPAPPEARSLPREAPNRSVSNSSVDPREQKTYRRS